MRSNIAHIAGWLIIVLVTLLFIGEAYASPRGVFERWERSPLVRRGDEVGQDRWPETLAWPAGSRAGSDGRAYRASARQLEHLENVAWLDDPRGVWWGLEGDSIVPDSDHRGRDAEGGLSTAGIWEEREDERDAFTEQTRRER